MWECGNCKEKIEDKYKHCWNCGHSKTEVQPAESSPVRIHLKDEPPSEEEIRSGIETPPEKEIPARNEVPPEKEFRAGEHFPFDEEEFPFKGKSPSVIGRIAPLLLWLAATVAVSYFAYYSHQKTTAFENRIAEEAANLNKQANQFVFSKNAPREKNAKVKAKVLPLDAKTGQVDGLYNFLPDNLRPATLEEVNTILWLDCSPKEVWRYEDGSPGYRESCNAYLADRNTSKIIQVEDFPGAMPSLKKNPGNANAAGKVLPEVYIPFIKANQPEAERAPAGLASDSPDHHFWFKSELLYAVILLGLLGAIGIGWIVFLIKSVIWKPK
jgi:hypothetical protein